ncbi:MAG: ParB/RepB/Spo0J family partition protein [Tannerella sp.]|jgi:ParB family chromosome partitioning protein|nr:ParB/RepB/Spo0J family partition protein [Tannerella sp.]
MLTVKDIPVGDISIKENVRREYTGIDELKASIRQHGLLQPITVYLENEGYIVKTGHRRYMAYQTLYQIEPERFHSIRCIVSDAENIAVIQLVENVQRVDLSQLDLFNALKALKAQGMTLKQIADVMGKTEQYIKFLFIGVNEMTNNDKLKERISIAGNTIQDIVETKGIDEDERIQLLDERKSGNLNRAGMREKVREIKSQKPETEYSPVPSTDRIFVRMKVFLDLREIVVFTEKNVSEKQLDSIGEDMRRFFINSDAYRLEVIAPDAEREKATKDETENSCLL